jgi:protein TonB
VWLEPDALARVVDAPLADLHAEILQARAEGRRWGSRWLAVRGEIALLTGLVWSAIHALWVSLPRLASIGLGGLLLPMAIFWMLAQAIEPSGEVRPLIHPPIFDLWKRPAPILKPPAAPPRRVKVEPPKDRGLPTNDGIGRVRSEGFPPPGRGDGWTLTPVPIERPRGTRLVSPREIDATPTVRIPPAYPPGAAARGIEGFVVVRLWIGTQGEVTRADAVQAQPRGVFERAALAAVRRWKYQPGRIGEEAVARGPFEVLLNFNLEDAER